jgi:hypothetical protein
MRDPRSNRPSSRTALQGLMQTQPQARAARPRPARRRGPLCDGSSHRIPRRRAPVRRSGRSAQSAPPFGLVFPGMQETRHRRGQVLGLFSVGLSVLALSALMLFPALSQANDSSGIQYSEAPPTATGGQEGNKPSHKEPVAHSSTGGDGSSNQNNSGHSKSSTSSGGSSGGSPSSKTGNPQSTSHDRGTGQGNPGSGSTGGEAPQVNHSGQVSSAPQGSSGQESGGSSPLVPILIAIAALAAISIGVVMLRARRQRAGRGGSVSPEAS